MILFQQTVSRDYELAKVEPVFADASKPPAAIWMLIPKGEDDRSFKLADQPTLFLTFAETRADRAGILEFARANGLLGYQTFVAEGYAEPISSWISEIRAMKEVVDLWRVVRRVSLDDAVPIDPTVTLAEQILMTKSDVYGNWTAASSTPILPNCEDSDRELEIFAYDMIGMRINERLRDVSPVIVWDWSVTAPDRYGQGSQEGALRLQIQPSCLIAALWLQLAQAVTDCRDFKKCSVCSDWILISPTEGRQVNVQYCSNACRQSAYRQRQPRSGDQKSPKSRRRTK